MAVVARRCTSRLTWPAVILALATRSVVLGQAVPDCAQACLVSAISKAGCDALDVSCQCGPSQAAIGSIASPCLISACNAADLASVASLDSSLCAGVTSTATTATPTKPTTSIGPPKTTTPTSITSGVTSQDGTTSQGSSSSTITSPPGTGSTAGTTQSAATTSSGAAQQGQGQSSTLQSSGGDGLSAGAKAGLAVGSVVGAALIAGLAYFVGRHQNRKPAAEVAAGGAQAGGEQPAWKSELEATAPSQHAAAAQQAAPAHELPATNSDGLYELESEAPRR